MADLKEELREETVKWRERLEERIENVTPSDDDGEDIIKNARAYHDDSLFFEEESDWIRSFETVIWGWSWLEIGEKLGKLEKRDEPQEATN